MQTLKGKIEKYTITNPVSTCPTEEWRELGKEIQQHYKKPLYWLIAPWKEQIWYVRQVFKECVIKEKPVNYFIAILKLKNVETGTPTGDERTV